MVATQAMVEAIGSVKVDDEADFTKAVFAQLLASAQAILDADNPGLSAALYDLAQAYMVMHLYEVKMNSAGLIAERIGDYSYSKGAGETSYLLIYRQLIDQASSKALAGSASLEGVTRCDAETPDAMMDQGDRMTFGESNDFDSGG